MDLVESNPALRRVELGEAKVGTGAPNVHSSATHSALTAASSVLLLPLCCPQRYAATINANVLEVSARSGTNVAEAFTGVTTTCVERAVKSGRDVGPSKDAKKLTKLQPPKSAEKKGCC